MKLKLFSLYSLYKLQMGIITTDYLLEIGDEMHLTAEKM